MDVRPEKTDPEVTAVATLPDAFKLRDVAEWVDQCGNKQMAEWLRREAIRSVKFTELDRMIGSAMETMMRSNEAGRLSTLDLGHKVSEVIAKLTEAAAIPEQDPIPSTKQPALSPRNGGLEK